MSEALHVVLGMDPDQWDAAMAEGRKTVGWSGMPASAEPRYHAHPALGIIGHSHSQTADARRPHVHRPEIGWTSDPIFVVPAAVDAAGADEHGNLSPAMEDWVLNVYAPSVEILAGVLAEMGATPDAADHAARACLARLTHHDPPITVDYLR